jgi:multidrug transporter EmrE-like cation transporter
MSTQINKIFLMSFIEIIGDFSYKYFAYTNKIKYLLVGFISYIGVQFFLIQSLKNSSVLYVNGMWDGMSGLLESIASIIFLGEKLTDTTQYLGLIFIICGIVLLKSNRDETYINKQIKKHNNK